MTEKEEEFRMVSDAAWKREQHRQDLLWQASMEFWNRQWAESIRFDSLRIAAHMTVS